MISYSNRCMAIFYAIENSLTDCIELFISSMICEIEKV